MERLFSIFAAFTHLLSVLEQQTIFLQLLHLPVGISMRLTPFFFHPLFGRVVFSVASATIERFESLHRWFLFSPRSPGFSRNIRDKKLLYQ